MLKGIQFGRMLSWRKWIVVLLLMAVLKIYGDFICVLKATNPTKKITNTLDSDTKRQSTSQILPTTSKTTKESIPDLPVFETEPKYHISKFVNENSTQPKPCFRPVFFLLTINSHTYHYKRRQGIRKSWGNGQDINTIRQDNFTWKTVFVVGRSGNKQRDDLVDAEAQRYGDIIIIDLREGHQSLTEKTVAGMYWAYKYCKPRFFYKGDDDVWINKWRMFEYISHLDKSGWDIIKKHWVGYVSRGNRKPIRNKKSKYYISPIDYKWNRFPPYCSGFSNLMSGIALERMVESVPFIKKLPGIDDVYVGLLAYRAGITPIHNYRFHYHWIYVYRHNFTFRQIDATLAEHGVVTPELQSKLTEKAHTVYLSKKKKKTR